MRFTKFPKHKSKGITKRRLANSERRLKKERDKFPLLSDWIAESQPTAEERIKAIDSGTEEYFQRLRDSHAQSWRESRKIFYSLPSETRQAVRRAWKESNYPGDGTYFKYFMDSYLKEGL